MANKSELQRSVDDGKGLLRGIRNSNLRGIALAIFAPKEIKVPGPDDHGLAYAVHVKRKGHGIVLHNLAQLFGSDSQAMNKLLGAINLVHKAYKAPEINHIRLHEALEQTTGTAMRAAYKNELYKDD